MLETIEAPLREKLIGNGFYEEDSQVTLTFVSSGYVLNGFVLLLLNYDGKRCFITELLMWTEKVRGAIGTPILTAAKI